MKIADIIAIRLAVIDNKCREELQSGNLVSERDYVSALTTRIRDNLKEIGIICNAQTLRQQDEMKNGSDGIIVFKYANEVKAGIFEAKRPRFTENNYRWDSLSKRKISHFTEQINKQQPWRSQLAIWEMFFNEGVDGFKSPPTQYFGSSCVWHNNAYNFMHQNHLIYKPWNTKELNELLSLSSVSFYSIIFDFVSCKAGKKFTIADNAGSFNISSIYDDNINLEIPLPVIQENINQEDFQSRVNRFLKSNNLDNYTYIDLDSDLWI